MQRRIFVMDFAVAALTLLTLALLPAPTSAQRAKPRLDPRTIRLKVGQFDPKAGVPTFPTVANINRYLLGVRGGYMVQFDRPITGADRKALKAAGASIKGYVPMMTLEVVMTEKERPAVEAIPGVRWVGVYQPAFKLHPGLLEAVQARFEPGEKIKLQISLFPGEDEPGMKQIRSLGARVMNIDRGRSFLVTQVEVASGQLRGLAKIPQVRYIEELYRPVPLNDRSRVHTGLDDVADDTFSSGLDPSLDGKDEASGFQIKYGHFDTGLENAHTDFNTAVVTFEPGADSNDLDNGHGTHTAGSIVGDGREYGTVPEEAPQTGDVTEKKWRGVTPQAALHHISFDNNYSDQQIFEREAEEGAQISSNSWGYASILGAVTDYNSNAAVWDEGVWDADDDVAGQQPLIVFFSAGNGGGWNTPYNGCSSNGPDNVGSPGTAKNVITVGNNETDRGAGGACGDYSGLGDNVEEMNASSSRGPVDPDGTGQGLFKPDVTNIGGYWVASTEATGTASQCSESVVEPDCPNSGALGYCSDTGLAYAYMNGTSMSCPLTAGMGGVLMQDLVVNRNVPEPKPSLIKALLINGARDLQPSSCNYTFDVSQSVIHQGWGFVQATNSLYGPNGTPGWRNIEFENEEEANAVATGGYYSRHITVATVTPLKVTLVWTDFPAAAGSGSPLVVNDLDLEVTGPDGTSFLGNNFVGEWSVPGGSADRYNVVENVYIQSPSSGTYTITVKGFQVSQDQEPDKIGVNQDFSLVWSGSLGPCESTCGNNTFECNEVCDGTDLGGETCESQGFDSGYLKCNSDCQGFDTSSCYDYVCGNGVKEGTEECDVSDFGGTVCGDFDCTGGELTCTGNCTIDISSCTDCPVCDNDGTCESGEDCSNCPDCIISGYCGDGICDPNEENCKNCASDCLGKTNGRWDRQYCCGDGEGDSWYPFGCDERCTEDGLQCGEVIPSCCGDLLCEGAEDSFNCEVDCGSRSLPCGDGLCESGEDCNNCPSDCISGMGGGTSCTTCFKGVCDGKCNPSKDGPDCADCVSSYCCGDGTCEGDEDSDNCGIDCMSTTPPPL
jgi:hypothetical protein